MTPEQIKELALCGVRGDTIKAISDELMKPPTLSEEQIFGLLEAGIRDIMAGLGATYITICMGVNDLVEIAYCGDDDDSEVEVEGATLAAAFNEAKSQPSCVDKALWG